MTETSLPDIQSGWAHRVGLFDLAPAEPDVSHILTAEDRTAIGELFARYAIAYDERRLDILRSCFTDDGVYQVQMGSRVLARFEGADQAVTGMSSVMQEQGPAQRRHVMTNLVLHPAGDGVVSAIAYATVIVTTDAGPTLGAAAVYGTTVIRDAGTWKFRKVMLGMDGYAGGAPTR
jgi:3-phenylpropionate/cinnamic acid dioxygenase small subunit